MQPLIHAVLCLLLSCCFQDAEARNYICTLAVPNGGQWGEWGKMEFCSTGSVKGFSFKVDDTKGQDNTALNGIRLYCNDGSIIESSVGPWGKWTTKQSCNFGRMISFSLRVQPPQGGGDDTAVTNFDAKCSNGKMFRGTELTQGEYGPWSSHCDANHICGIQTKVQTNQGSGDDTALNDVKFFTCS